MDFVSLINVFFFINFCYLVLFPIRFDYMAIAVNKQREMPSADDRKRGQVLAFPEAVLLTNPPFKGQVQSNSITFALYTH